MQICTRRRCPSDTLFMYQSGSTSSTFISLLRRSAVTPCTFAIICPAEKPPCNAAQDRHVIGVICARTPEAIQLTLRGNSHRSNDGQRSESEFADPEEPSAIRPRAAHLARVRHHNARL